MRQDRERAIQLGIVTAEEALCEMAAARHACPVLCVMTISFAAATDNAPDMFGHVRIRRAPGRGPED
ncbi:hypothetical protein GCM10010388_50920 [Streptomyces mauvecolor]